MGSVVNMSSGGVLVASKHEITVGSRMEISIEWPSLLDGQVPLQLVATGRVVRCDTFSFAMGLASHQFRTRTRAIIPMDMSRGEAFNVAAKRAVGA